jgi:ribosomal protein L11 methyltransferase
MNERPVWHCRFTVKTRRDFSLATEPVFPRSLARKLSLAVHEHPERRQLVCDLYFTDRPLRDDLTAAAAALSRHLGRRVPVLKPRRLPQKDWRKASGESFKPLKIVRFIVFSHNLQPPLAEGMLPLKIEAGLAFGTGSHETTRGSLLALQSLKGNREPKACLDLGCGSGILAIAMARLWPKAKIIASDIDPVAVTAAKRAFRANALSGIRAVLAEGFAHPALREAKFDLVAANVLLRPLLEMAPDFAQHLRPKGALVLSGILKTQEPEIRAAFTRAGLAMANRHCLGEWPTLVFLR